MRFAVRMYGAVGSTMDTARQLARDGVAHGTVVVAATQTGGRGRRGRTWHSPPAGGLYLTVVLRPPASARASAGWLSLAAGVAVAETARSLGVPATVKWPNDVWVDERKLAGVLLEAEGWDTRSPLVLLGVGLNVAPTIEHALPASLTSTYTGLADHGVTLAPAAALSALLPQLEQTYAAWLQGDLVGLAQRYHAVDALQQRWVRADAGALVEGVAQGVDGQARLRLLVAGKIVTIGAGEVVCIRPADRARVTPVTGDSL